MIIEITGKSVTSHIGKHAWLQSLYQHSLEVQSGLKKSMKNL